MKNNKKKGFTLVELLVVIAIIAILATVSVVGYLGFTKKAHESRAVSELTQVKTVLLASLTDGKEVGTTYTFKLENNALTVVQNVDSADAKASFEAAVKDVYGDLKDLKGTLSFDGNVVTYTLDGNTASATWTVDGGNVEVK